MEQVCPGCGAEVEPGDRFCASCGSPLTGQLPPAIEATTRVSERRLVSVLFADLVGFTSLAEHGDPEGVRDLLSEYFDECRLLVERYGGVVEKFIGDAVMAVWGSPVAREDDAERAVRAALALTRAVSDLGERLADPDLRLRVGVLTGRAAVELGAEAEGMVLGDTVNTASRLQSLAEPGSVFVDDVTRRASEAAIAYEDAGVHVVKGRQRPVHAWRALRVVAGAGGARRPVGPEAPFVGRRRELVSIIEAGDASAREARARHVVVLGEAGTGKSRLLWEFFKHLDGVQEVRWWHHGRCLPYGEGVAFWALAEIVRSRAAIVEDDPPELALAKLRATIAEHVPQERERRLVEPRLAHLLRLEDRQGADRADLFSGWRLFFERLADVNPVVLAFEDLQWADSGMLDFIEYLLEWSTESPIFVLSLARPELAERRPGWRPLVLGPLDEPSIAQILEGLAPGMPPDVVAAIGRRAEGIPLYAVETVRMLRDRGALVPDGDRYTVTGDIETLEVPETLHALAASRLDTLSAAERSLLQDASVLGRSFSAAGAAAIGERPLPEVHQELDALVVKQVLGRDDAPRSPRRGEYVFLQALLQNVAYGMLARQGRKRRHLAAARFLERSPQGQSSEIAEVLAAHYLEAIHADPDAADVDDLRRLARERLVDAGNAAASLALGLEAQRYFEQAAALTEDTREQARLSEWSGTALQRSGDSPAPERLLRRAIELYERAGVRLGGTATVGLARILRLAGRVEEARALLEAFRDVSPADADPIVRAEALAELAVTHVFAGALTEAGPLFDEALAILELEQVWPALADALVAHGVYFVRAHRVRESEAVLRAAVALAEERDLPSVVLRARYNLAGLALWSDRFAEAVAEANAGLALARERGDRSWIGPLRQQTAYPLCALGQWDQASDAIGDLSVDQQGSFVMFAADVAMQIASARGDAATVATCVAIASSRSDSGHVDERASAASVLAREALDAGAARRALTLIEPLLREAQQLVAEAVEELLALAVEAAMSLDEDAPLAQLSGFVTALPPARATPLLLADRSRVEAEQAHRRGESAPAWAHEEEALASLRQVGARPLIAQVLIERGRRHDDAGALAEAREICLELGATRWLSDLGEVVQATPAADGAPA